MKKELNEFDNKIQIFKEYETKCINLRKEYEQKLSIIKDLEDKIDEKQVEFDKNDIKIKE